MRKLLLAAVALALLGGLMYPVWLRLVRDRGKPAATRDRPLEDGGPGLGEIEDVNPFDSVRVDDETGTWVLYLLAEENLVDRVRECQAFVADGRFHERYPAARGKPVGLRVELSRPLARALREKVDQALSQGPLVWFEPK